MSLVLFDDGWLFCVEIVILIGMIFEECVVNCVMFSLKFRDLFFEEMGILN